MFPKKNLKNHWSFRFLFLKSQESTRIFWISVKSQKKTPSGISHLQAAKMRSETISRKPTGLPPEVKDDGQARRDNL